LSGSQGLVTAQNNNGKYEQWVMCSKSSVVIALRLLPTENTEFGKKLMVSKRNRKQKVL
jgi:hypothetical protein